MNFIAKLNEGLREFHNRLGAGPAKDYIRNLLESQEIGRAELEVRLAESQIAFNLSHAELNGMEIMRLKEPHYKAAMDRRVYLDKQIVEAHEELVRLKKEAQRLSYENQRLKKLNEELKWNKTNIKPTHPVPRKDPSRATIGDAVAAKKAEKVEEKKEEKKVEVLEMVEFKNPADATRMGELSDEEMEKLTRPAGFLVTTA